MTTIGITGGMGSGKSHVSKSFESNGIPAYDCDSKVKSILNDDTNLKVEICNKFGNECYISDKKFMKWNREYIVKIAAKDPSVIDEIGKIIEPYLVEDFIRFKAEYKSGIVAIESAILTKSKKLMDEIDKLLVVTAPFEIRMDRIKKRDPFRIEDEIKLLLSKQPEILLCEIDFLIDNDGNEDIDDAVVTIINRLIT